MCLDGYIGIRGECTDATMYLDDLPGINIIQASEFTNDIELRPIDLVRKSASLAQKELLKDIIDCINVKYISIIDDNSIREAGGDDFYGEIDEECEIIIDNLQDDKFTILRTFGFELVSDREVTVEFKIIDSYGIEEIITADLKKGLNAIPIDKKTNSQSITISFNLKDFKVGSKKNKYCGCKRTEHCNTCKPCGCSSVTSKGIGFNLCIRCESDECAIFKYLIDCLEIAWLYRTGINYLLEAKMSCRETPYTRNKEEDIEHLLTLWMGGYDNQEGVYMKSLYKQKVKQAAKEVEGLLLNSFSKTFQFSGTTTCNVLP